MFCLLSYPCGVKTKVYVVEQQRETVYFFPGKQRRKNSAAIALCLRGLVVSHPTRMQTKPRPSAVRICPSQDVFAFFWCLFLHDLLLFKLLNAFLFITNPIKCNFWTVCNHLQQNKKMSVLSPGIEPMTGLVRQCKT